jgi:hypothetical protein
MASAITAEYADGPEPQREIVADEQRGDADTDRAELSVAEQQRLPVFVGSPLPVDLGELSPGPARNQILEVPARRKLPPFLAGIRVDDSQAGGVDDRRKGDVLRVEARLENRPQPRIVLECLHGVAGPLHGLEGPVENRLGDQLRTGLAFVQADLGEPRQVHQAQACRHGADDQRDA